MKVFRIDREKYIHSTLSGIGASKSNSNRWNSEYTRMVYSSGYRSLSALEIAVHLDSSEDFPADRLMVEIDIPDDIDVIEVSIEDLPIGWDSKPPTSETQKIGDLFVQGQKAAVLKVPSAIINKEFNYLINPDHPDSELINTNFHEAFFFDERLKQENQD